LSFLFLQSLYLGIRTTAHDRTFQQICFITVVGPPGTTRICFIAMVGSPGATLASARTGSH